MKNRSANQQAPSMSLIRSGSEQIEQRQTRVLDVKNSSGIHTQKFSGSKELTAL